MINIEYGNRSIPLVYDRLERREEATYEEIHRVILNRILQLNVMLQVQAFSLDFEVAAHNANFIVFHLEVYGCFY